eukprot:7918298-Ditylum_brightwellii.AAC.1
MLHDASHGPLGEKGSAVLVEDTIATNRTQQPIIQHREILEHVRCVYTWILLQGKLQQAVHWITSQEKGELLQPSDRCSKTGKLINKVLLSKNPCPLQPLDKALPEYNELLDLINLDITAYTVEQMATQMQGAAGLEGVD